ncbi:unnamed protein product [Linum tenue]|uniref:Uncharacterized protein n=1 Tax=Linum tenue TaxID=586396 RepID=A0AAV0RXG5_9ROSI|nr:unnamed protein product [Linum tenue]
MGRRWWRLVNRRRRRWRLVNRWRGWWGLVFVRLLVGWWWWRLMDRWRRWRWGLVLIVWIVWRRRRRGLVVEIGRGRRRVFLWWWRGVTVGSCDLRGQEAKGKYCH